MHILKHITCQTICIQVINGKQPGTVFLFSSNNHTTPFIVKFSDVIDIILHIWMNPLIINIFVQQEDWLICLTLFHSLRGIIQFKSNGRPNRYSPALESSEGTQTSTKAKMKSSGETWIAFAFQLLLLYPQTHPGTAKWAFLNKKEPRVFIGSSWNLPCICRNHTRRL